MKLKIKYYWEQNEYGHGDIMREMDGKTKKIETGLDLQSCIRLVKELNFALGQEKENNK